MLYSYLNLESTKTKRLDRISVLRLYSYLNLESTKTMQAEYHSHDSCTVT